MIDRLRPAPLGSDRRLRLLIVLLVLCVYVAVDGIMLAQRTTFAYWNFSTDRHGTITWVDPNGAGTDAGLRVGDRLVQPGGLPAIRSDRLADQPVLQVIRLGRLHARATFGNTEPGQALALAGLLFLIIGGLMWAFGPTGRAPVLLGILNSLFAVALLGAVWGNDGYLWAMRLTPVIATSLVPIAWALFFLSFPSNLLAERKWRLISYPLFVLAATPIVLYPLYFLIRFPYAVSNVLGNLVLMTGFLLGLAALIAGRHGDDARSRQQRTIILVSAAVTILPFLFVGLLPSLVTGVWLVSPDTLALTMVALPLGFAYAVARYDLMELDLTVRRLVAGLAATFALIGITVVAALVLHPFVPNLDLPPLVLAVLAGAAASRQINLRARHLAERLLSPELLRSQRVVAGLDPELLKGTQNLVVLAERLEAEACAVSGADWSRLYVRKRGSGAAFSAPDNERLHVVAPQLAALVADKAWGVSAADRRHPVDPGEWLALTRALGRAPAVILPLTMRGEVIALLAVGERSTEQPLRGPDREAVAHLLDHFCFAVDYARVRNDLAAESADAAALSAATAALTASLDDRSSLPQRIVTTLLNLRDATGAGVILYGLDGTPSVAATQGLSIAMDEPPDLVAATFATSPYPYAWLPLNVGKRLVGSVCLRWAEHHVVTEHDRRLLAVYANGAAMALEHAALYERTRLQAERDPVTDLLNHRTFHRRLEQALERGRDAEQPAGLLLLDVYDFKLFNDTNGHHAGDQALRRIAQILQSCCDPSASVARLGGDEFAVLLPGADSDAAHALAAHIDDMIHATAVVAPDGQHLPIRLAIGLASCPADADAPNALLSRAAKRLHEAKRAGLGVSAAPLQAKSDDDTADRFGMIESLVAMVDNRDKYTAEHSEQVASYACAIGAEIGLSRETIETLRTAGMLHDVGKIGVPDHILRKPGKLTDEEFDIVKRHVEVSEALMTIVTTDIDLLNAVRYHHERWDGRGYPYHLAGEDVPLLGRIMIVADAVSAMGMDRPYRKGLPWDVIYQELIRGSGRQFDPALIEPALRSLAPLLEHQLVA